MGIIQARSRMGEGLSDLTARRIWHYLIMVKFVKGDIEAKEA
jgi:hypothetical protein